jgi:hypothetical protein
LDGFLATVQIANPASFIAQKILIHGKRTREERTRDILYLHDTLDVFGARMPDLQACWRDKLRGRLSGGSRTAVGRSAHLLFGSLSDDIQRAARIFPERGLDPESIRSICHYGLLEIFGKT